MIDPGAITFIQTTFLQHLQSAFYVVLRYALNLLYLFAAMEVVLFGLLWALQQGIGWERIFFKVLKIGLILFIIQAFPSLLNSIIQSFADIGGKVTQTNHLSRLIFDPANIWQYGYDIGLQLLKLAVLSSGIGLALLQIILGIGILLVFGLLGIQIVLQIVAFYLVSLTALIMLPLGVFNPTAAFFENGIQSVLKAGVRVMTLIIVMGIAVTVWNGFHFTELQTNFNINEPLGLFFTALLFLLLAIKLPQYASEVIGQMSMQLSSNQNSHTVEVINSITPSAVQSSSAVSPVQSATTVNVGTSMNSGVVVARSAEPIAVGQNSAASTTMTPILGSSISAQSFNKTKGESRLDKASHVDKSISDVTLKKIKKTVISALRDSLNEQKTN